MIGHVANDLRHHKFREDPMGSTTEQLWALNNCQAKIITNLYFRVYTCNVRCHGGVDGRRKGRSGFFFLTLAGGYRGFIIHGVCDSITVHYVFLSITTALICVLSICVMDDDGGYLDGLEVLVGLNGISGRLSRSQILFERRLFDVVGYGQFKLPGGFNVTSEVKTLYLIHYCLIKFKFLPS